ncbi:MAG: hypothetical protein ABSE62_06855 [Chthoniobacteraceae bacterium]|jgi:hypothetical protein
MPKDWLSSIKENVGNGDDEFELSQLEPGDLLRIVTEHTRYDFVFVAGRDADLRTDREDRPHGRVRIMGCTFGSSATIKPDHLFCGGRLEFTFNDGAATYLTSGIKEIRCVSRRED